MTFGKITVYCYTECRMSQKSRCVECHYTESRGTKLNLAEQAGPINFLKQINR